MLTRITGPALLFIALAGCPGGGDGVSEGEGEGEGDGDVHGSGGLGDVCGDDGGCGDGFVCGSFFQNPQLPKSCLPTCSDPRGDCDVDGDGVDDDDCGELPGLDAPVCLFQAGLLEPCGNGVSGVCAIEAFCAVSDDDDAATAVDDRLVGLCVIPCSAEGLCDFDLSCSDDVRVNDGAGVCVEATAVGDPCGRGDDGSLVVCTGDQTCTDGVCAVDG